MISLELQDAMRERCVYLIVIALLISPISMVATIIRRRSRQEILRDHKRTLIDAYKTGIHPNEVVNEAIDKVDQESRESGPGITPSSVAIPLLLKKRREVEQRGDNDRPKKKFD